MSIRSNNYPVNSSAQVMGRSAASGIRNTRRKLWLLVLVVYIGFVAAAQGQQYLSVDCTGQNTSDYPTINAALQAVTGPGFFIIVNGTCDENLQLTNYTNLSIGAQWEQTANLVGAINIQGSDSIYIYGLHTINPSGNGFNINSSRAVILASCISSYNPGLGVNVGSMSDVTISGPSTFDYNGKGGIQVYDNSSLNINNYQGPTDVSNNLGPGLWLSGGALFQTIGSTTFANNTLSPPEPGQTGTYGIELLGASKAQIGTCFGPNLIEGNKGGGIYLQENSEISLWDCSTHFTTEVVNNGPVGISAGLGSQVTLFHNAHISGHSLAGVELYGKSQLNVTGSNLISGNGTAGNPQSAAIVVDGNSEAYLRGGDISSNNGPGLLLLVNSSADIEDAKFAGNTGGVASCDSSSLLSTNQPDLSVHPSTCLTPQASGAYSHLAIPPGMPDSSVLKARQELYQKVTSKRRQ